MEAKKAAHFVDYAAYEKILASRSCAEQAAIAADIKGFKWHEWAEVEESHVRAGVNEKLRQHPKILRALQATGDAVIANCSPYDYQWGTGYALNSNTTKDPKKWGKNRLGELLMEIRRNGISDQ